MSESPDGNEVSQKSWFLLLTTSVPLAPFRETDYWNWVQNKGMHIFSHLIRHVFLSQTCPSRPATRVHERQTRLPATPARSGNDRIMAIAVKRAAFGVTHRTVKLKINPYSTTVPNCDIDMSFAFFLAQLVLISLAIVCDPFQVIIYSPVSSRLAWQGGDPTSSIQYRAIQAPQDGCCAGSSHTLRCLWWMKDRIYNQEASS